MNLNLTQLDLKQKLNQRETVIFLATLLVAFLGFYKSCVVPNQQALSDTKEQTQTFETERNRLIKQVAAQKEPKPQDTSHNPWVGTPDALNETMDSLGRPLQLKGISLVDLQLSDIQKKEDPFNQKGIVLTLSGNFQAIGQYIEHLENLPIPLLIESFSIAPDGNQLSTVVVKIQGGFYVSK